MVSMKNMVQTSPSQGLTASEKAPNHPGRAEDRSTQLDLSHYCLDRALRAVLPFRPAPAHEPRLPGRNGHMRHTLHTADSAAMPSPRTLFPRLGDLRYDRQRVAQAGGPAQRQHHPIREDLCLRDGPRARQTDAGRMPRAPGARPGDNPQKNVRPTGIFYSPLPQMNASTGFPL
jgi:hypothetical protein